MAEGILEKPCELIAIVGIIVVLASCSLQPGTLKAQGSVTSSNPVSLAHIVGNKRSGMGNDSMQKYREYKITEGGKTLAVGKLHDGVGVSGGAKEVKCEFKFSRKLKAGLKFYTLDMGGVPGAQGFQRG
ncbi:hypothetical protein [Pseudarthrobacter sp. PS3-L1]|uniref:hypothetical protein n=1 Tax=Pseudarthrobacter sp. PS3-L1 TaxID=3046207 RepID=UPI0024BA6E31|nr:hypothetical protein [Pseudarthrobacter sp. PS3-L1]MDJ0319995.1 hypothetical protein [Pseudarthrobacter sp. PS3-L1]